MATLGEVTFEREGVYYELEVEFELDRSSDRALVHTITARATREGEEPYEVQVELEIRVGEGLAIVTLPTGSTARIALSSLNADWQAGEEGAYPPGTSIEDGATSPDPFYEEVASQLNASLIEVIADIPLGDPIACLVKAGITSVVGQTLICNELDGGRLRAILGCLRDHIPGISRHTAIRTVKCMLF